MISREQFPELFFDSAKAAYIKIMGAAKWEGLSDTQKHDAVMCCARDLLNGLEIKHTM